MGGCIFTFFKACFGVRQGSVLSPYLFVLYLDDLIDGRTNDRTGFVIMYADDIIILSSTLTGLQHLLRECEKSCLRIGHRFDSNCCPIATLPWVNN